MNKSDDPNGKQALTLNDLWRIILRRWWFVLGSLILGLFISFYFNQITIPLFKSSTLVLVENKMASRQAIFQFRSVNDVNKQINNEKNILRSRKVMSLVIDSLINSRNTDLYILGKKFNGSFDKFSNLIKLIENIPGFEPSSYFVSQNRPISKWNDEDIRRSAAKLRGQLQVSQINNTELISIAVSAPSPEEAALLSNTVAQIYQAMDISRSRADVKGVKDFLTSRLNDVSVSLKESEIVLLEHQEKNGMLNISSSSEELISQSSKFESEYLATQIEIKTFKKELEIKRTLLSEAENTLLEQVGSISSPLIKKLRTKIANLESSILIENSKENDSWIISTKKKIEELKIYQRSETEKILKTKLLTINPLEYREDLLEQILLLKSKNATLEEKSKSLVNIKKILEDRLDQLPEKILKYARLERDRQINENVFLLLKTKFIEYGISEQTQLGSVQIIDPAVPNYSPISPNKKKNLTVGFLVGTILSIVILLLKDILNNTIRSKKDLEEFRIPLLGIIPFAKTKNRLSKFKWGKNNSMRAFRNRLVSHFDSKSPISESYRHLRTGLHFIKHDGDLCSIAVLSSGPKEGKSSTAINLGITYAQLGKKTLLVDSDLRRPIIHKAFGMKNTPGLVNVINGDENIDSVICDTQIENLFTISCGTTPPNPSEILASDSMDKILQELSEKFDKIILDTPPINAVADGAIVSRKCDGSILVIASNITHRDAFRHAIDYLSRIETNLLGLVLNRVKKFHAKPAYYYYSKN